MWRREDVIKKIIEDKGELTLASYAQVVGCSTAYISRVLNNDIEPGPRLLNRFNLKRVKTITYEEKRRWK